MRLRIPRGLPWLLIGIVTVGGSRVAWGQHTPPSPYHYYYFDQKVALTCDTKQVALFESAAEAGQTATLSQGVAQFGIARDKLVQSPIPTLWMAETPTTIRDATGVEGLVATVSTAEQVGFASPVFRDARGDPIIISQHIHVGFHEAANRQDAEATLAGLNAGVIEARDWTGMQGVYRIRSASRNGFEVLELANRLAQMPLVKFAEPDMLVTGRKSLIPNDPFFSLLWGLHNTGQSGGTVDMDMDGPEAWNISTGDPSIVVAILDDGTQQNHPDINQVPGADFTGSGTGGGPANACENHGTAVAGCTSAIINNSIGVVGIAPGCKIVGLKFNKANVPCDGSFSFFFSWLVNALNFAQTSGARVTNNSNFHTASSTITNKYQSTRNAGLIHFAATGNGGLDGIGDPVITYPASLSTVNAVGAINRFGNRASFSNYGSGLAFVAPGVSIASTDRTGQAGYVSGDYVTVNGTSFASPYAAGVAAMVLTANAALTPDEIEQVMNSTAKDRGAAGYDTFYGWGIVNAFAAMEQVASPPPPTIDPSGTDKNRYISFAVPTGAAAGVAGETAIQIELTTLNHMCSAESDNLYAPCVKDGDCINGVCARRFTASEGQLRYVNVVKTCQVGATSTGEVICRSLADCAIDEECLQFRTCDGTTDLCASDSDCAKGVPCLASMSCPDDVFKPPFLCATTGCEPEYRDWAGDLAGGVLHVYGPGIVPARSEYYLRQIPAACAGSEASCPTASDSLMITTARWADMTADGSTNAQDITAASDKVKPIPEALTKPRTMLIPGTLNPFRNVNVTELQNTVDAVKSLPMSGSIAGPEDCGT